MIDSFLSTAVYQDSFTFFQQTLQAKVSAYGVLIILTSLWVYPVYIKRIFERDIPPPISAWSLWLLLDVVAVSAEFKAGNFNVQLIVYTLGTIAVCISLLRRSNLSWDKVWDNITALSVLAAIFLWKYTNDPMYGLVLSLVGMTIAAIPMVISIINGAKEAVDIWMVIFIGSVISYFDGNKISGVWIALLQISIVFLIISQKRKA